MPATFVDVPYPRLKSLVRLTDSFRFNTGGDGFAYDDGSTRSSFSKLPVVTIGLAPYNCADTFTADTRAFTDSTIHGLGIVGD